MTGGGRAPAVAHERAEKQDLGLDASSHFSGEGVLHSLTGQLMRRERGFCPATPLSPLHCGTTLSFLISSLLLKLFWGECVQFRIVIIAPVGAREHTSPYRENSRASGCWAQGPLKGWNEKGNMCLLFFPSQKHFQVSK